jgi:hypothetical protein
MKTRVLVFGATLSALAATSAMAQERYGHSHGGHYAHRDDDRYDDDFGAYMGVSAGSLIYKERELDTLSPTILEFRIGQQFSPFVAIEGRIGTGINNDERDGYKLNVQAVYGGYVKGIVPLSPWFSGYGLAGVGGVQLHRNYPDFNSSDAGLSFGFGAEFKLGGGASLNAEWLRLTTGTNDRIFDYTADQLTFGVNWHF